MSRRYLVSMVTVHVRSSWKILRVRPSPNQQLTDHMLVITTLHVHGIPCTRPHHHRSSMRRSAAVTMSFRPKLTPWSSRRSIF